MFLSTYSALILFSYKSTAASAHIVALILNLIKRRETHITLDTATPLITIIQVETSPQSLIPGGGLSSTGQPNTTSLSLIRNVCICYFEK